MNIDVGAMPLDELKSLAKTIERELQRRSNKNKAEFLARVKELAKTMGCSIEDALREVPKERTVKIKYRNPKDMTQTWTGRGRKPQWVEAWLANGGSMDELLIPQTEG